METARSFGNYDLALALADIIDNSITAGAKNIYIEANFDIDKISISDDGHGMTRDELIVAMRIGSKILAQFFCTGDSTNTLPGDLCRRVCHLHGLVFLAVGFCSTVVWEQLLQCC